MSTSTLTDEENEEYVTENPEGINNRSSALLKTENEKYRQEIHNLKRKLELNETMLREVQEANEMLERTLDQRVLEKDKIISTIEEKHRAAVHDYERTISDLETTITKQTTEIEELKQHLNQKEAEPLTTTTDQILNASFEAANASLNDQINELLSIIQEERKQYKCAEDAIEKLQNRCDELESYSNNMKERLDEKTRALDDARAELALRHTETAALEAIPTRDACKGNSLFAEVDDRRRNVTDKMNALREKYTEIKRVCKSQATEIKMLRAERAAAYRKWENDADQVSAVNDELIQKYKNRISDLESKLKLEIKKNDDTKKEDSGDVVSLQYFQTLMYTKNKEMDQLRVKIEDLSTKMLVQEETKMNTIKQLQYWRHKATTLEAQVAALQAEAKSDVTNDADCTISNE
ncbi:spindle apparatus coiled-coil protein 1 spindly [Megachile rotundata]|uniref:spindle apparatus coiled-coil protein 1 spindly n=1 Tax=Megachile rotundata TaxID=143995 RepID=UPI003FD0DF92